MFTCYLEEPGDSDRSWREHPIFHNLPVGGTCVEGVHDQLFTDLWKMEVEVGEALCELTQRLPRGAASAAGHPAAQARARGAPAASLKWRLSSS
jgi:hypothetical protein